MGFTQEQKDIIQSNENLKINAVAGSGKTTTLIEFAKAQSPKSKILYLAFNKSVRMEAEQKFATNGLNNVRAETAHSLAYKHIVRKFGYKVRAQSYKTNEIVQILKLELGGEKLAEYMLATHINKFISCFCNSDKRKISELNYLDYVSDAKARQFVGTYYKVIELQTRIFLGKMDKAEIDITHDFYLKKFQLSQPSLPYDFILFDEAQDASPAMLDVFLHQQATKILVGDTHQQIYSWRFAVNSLEKVDFATKSLSASFRFNADIARLAVEVLQWKNHLEEQKLPVITGAGGSNLLKTKAVIARSNLGLLLKAIEYTVERNAVKNIYFEGGIHSYTYADEGTSLYDVLNLHLEKRHLIRDDFIKRMKSLNELEEYIEKTEDMQLGMMVDIVKEYGRDIPIYLEKIKSKHVENDRKEDAEVIFSTVHRSKGMEYDSVYLVNDFINEEKLIKILDSKENTISKEKLNEEINLLYVAITRTKNQLFIPEELLPKDFPESPQIQLIKAEAKPTSQKLIPPIESSRKQRKRREKMDSEPETAKTYSYEKVRETHKRAYLAWTPEMDDELTELFCKGSSAKEIAEQFGRSVGAIISRIKKLELADLYDLD